jgi:hypothetical protein
MIFKISAVNVVIKVVRSIIVIVVIWVVPVLRRSSNTIITREMGKIVYHLPGGELYPRHTTAL